MIIATPSKALLMMVSTARSSCCWIQVYNLPVPNDLLQVVVVPSMTTVSRSGAAPKPPTTTTTTSPMLRADSLGLPLALRGLLLLLSGGGVRVVQGEPLLPEVGEAVLDVGDHLLLLL